MGTSGWDKLGCIFPPAPRGKWLATHASVPIAEHLEGDVYRIYFSPRDREGRSHTGWFDLDLTRPYTPLRVAAEPLLSPGEPGAFDDAGAMGSWLLNVGTRKYFYYIGWNRGVSVPFRNAIGLAMSEDGGQTYARVSPGPILDRSRFDPTFTASSCVLPAENGFRMWYLSGLAWEQRPGGPQPRYHLKSAESPDGIAWTRTGHVCIDFQSPGEHAISRPCVLHQQGLYRMWYSYRGERYRIGYAESPDGLAWQRLDELAGIDVSETGWDSEMIEYPFVFVHGGARYLLYNGNGYGATGIGLAVQPL